ncbi:MAG TPA: ABC transporter ATP-binding protein [Candidatus Methanoculleus thermohydrogenotrophicum]|jgi:iron complex transport system ATP-binding protein|nr:ABC transporter ATP-binding protein [Candidatus Methanoculleus thermohydrogenotrophicum]NLM81442.1 ABC transporter ATP-binding protein [Candidatus Methanoculleus thermohydrogenotrophicum]HOB18540.1 ABC transporter ATP-binding protein [Candidatus Methanoculleus thermohydrogenotrophicum]HPZ38657.1 ABC transporter ATP-binding protein [Candidatus Methanoculleus thermohydrogenotrophicum]HQC91832.1 ABC transporter ATP-binding protein [Candidatus Methanoculleus thermohydrogenotrophicum]
MILEVDGVVFTYRSAPVIQDITFDLRPHQTLAILGPNGVGKTTLLKCMNAILKPKAGSIFVEGLDLLSADRMEIARRMGYVPQRSEAGRITAFDAILLGRRPHIGWNVSERDLQIVEAAIRMLRLEDLSLRYIDEMSGGELQKVSIARALVQEPRVLLLDEPTSSLDLRNQIEILEIVRSVVAEHDVAAVMTMHDLNMALRYADRFIFLKDGLIHAAGGPEVVTAETIEEVYGVPVVVERYNGYQIIIPRTPERTPPGGGHPRKPGLPQGC